jgi:phage major head subunit gpT-like protein
MVAAEERQTMRKSLLQTYHELKESGNSADFPNVLANVMYKVLIDKFKGVASPWKQYTTQSPLSDFKTNNRVLVGEANDLLEVSEQGDYADDTLSDYNYQIGLKTFGRKFSIGRQLIINDDLGAIRRQPERFGRAAARTLAKKVVAAIESDGNTYDGKTLFHNDHNNKTNAAALANTQAGAAQVFAGMALMRNATEPSTSEKMGIQPKYLLTSPTNEGIAQQLIRSAQIWPVSTNGGGTMNPIGSLQILIEPFLTSTTSAYIMADPNDCPVVEVGFLDGKDTPDLLMKRADTVNLAGGEDQWGYDFDEIFYKVRYDFAVARAMYQGIVRLNP